VQRVKEKRREGARQRSKKGEEIVRERDRGWKRGTPTKRQVSKRQVAKRPVSKCLKRQVYKTSALQNIRFTKRQVYKMSGLQKVRLQKKTSIYILYLWLVEIRRFCCSHVCRQSNGCVLLSILAGFFAINHHNR
jgi:hypothetical protein